MKVIIIGGIAAGMSAASKLKRLKPEAVITVYEKNEYISFGACGLPYYVGGFFENKSQMFARTPEKINEIGIGVKVGHEVLEVDSNTQCVKVKELKTGHIFEDHYDELMIATGARALVPPISNLELENVHFLRSMEDGDILKTKLRDEAVKHVGIIGAGFIGLEVVEAAKKLGKEVSIFQLEDRVLKEVFDKEVTEIIENHLVEEGVHLHLNTKVTGLIGEEKVTGIETETARYPVDLVILATGVKPNTDFITTVDKIGNGAIKINQYGQTSIQNIYAAGDCAVVPHILKEGASYIPLATSANKLGRIVGENLAGRKVAFEGTLGSSCLKILDLEAGRTGLSEEEAKRSGLEYRTVWMTDKNHTDYYPGQEALSIKLIYEAATYKIVGGQVIGKSDAVQRANVLAVAIYAGLTTKQLGMLDLCYAPPFSRTWDALNIAGNIAK